MEKITLQPNVWTRLYASVCFQSKSNQSGIRIHYGEEAPAPDTDLYFTTQEYDLKPYMLPEWLGTANTYLMPDENQTIDIVAF